MRRHRRGFLLGPFPMRHLRRVCCLILLQLGCVAANAFDIEVGDRAVSLPPPDGFVELTPEMSPYYEGVMAFIPPGNTHFLTLITSADAAAIRRGENIELGRYFNVQSQDAIANRSISSAQFAELRLEMRAAIGVAYEQVKERLPDLLDTGTTTLNEEFGTDLAVEVQTPKPLPVHLDSPTAFAHSLTMTFGTGIEGEDMDATKITATTLLLHVKDKVLFIYAYGGEQDLEWTREVSATWANAILAANPLSLEEQAAVDKPGGFGGFDWGRILEKGLIGGLIGGGIAGFLGLFRRWKKN